MKIELINGWELLLGASQFPNPQEFVQVVRSTIHRTAVREDTFFFELKLALEEVDSFTVELKDPESKRITVKYTGSPVGFKNDDEKFYMDSLSWSRL